MKMQQAYIQKTSQRDEAVKVLEQANRDLDRISQEVVSMRFFVDLTSHVESAIALVHSWPENGEFALPDHYRAMFLDVAQKLSTEIDKYANQASLSLFEERDDLNENLKNLSAIAEVIANLTHPNHVSGWFSFLSSQPNVEGLKDLIIQFAGMYQLYGQIMSQQLDES